MPYIQPQYREKAASHPRNAGELNYALSMVLLQYMYQKSTDDGKMSYQILNDILGALEGAKQEFYRRVIVPYEEGKIADNGDIYPQ